MCILTAQVIHVELHQASSARAGKEIQTNTVVGGIFVSINVHNSLKCTVAPIFFFDKSLSLVVLRILSKNREILNVRRFHFFAISTQMRWSFSVNAGTRDFQLSFCEACFT